MSTKIIGQRFYIYAAKAKAKPPIWSDDLQVGNPPELQNRKRRHRGSHHFQSRWTSPRFTNDDQCMLCPQPQSGDIK